MDWQPIETAPKSTTPVAGGNLVDGYYILGYCPEEGASPASCMTVVWWEPYEHHNRGAWKSDGDYEVHPTHWMPLPEPPTFDNAP